MGLSFFCLAGLSNMVSGLLGAGFTGSYIFSQTIFSMRAHVQSKLHGLIIAGGAPRGQCPSLEI